MVDRTAAGLLLAVVALLMAAPASAAAPDADRQVWDAYPLPTPDAAVRPAADAPAPRGEMAAAPSDDVERLAIASLLALVAGALTTWLVTLRWPHMSVAAIRAPAVAPLNPPRLRSAPDLWLHDLAPPATEPVAATTGVPAPASCGSAAASAAGC
jgi:hypothetical protein